MLFSLKCTYWPHTINSQYRISRKRGKFRGLAQILRGAQKLLVPNDGQ